VKFEFGTPEPVYPLRISSINKGASEIDLYVFAEHRQQEQGFEVSYASRVTAGEMSRYPTLNKLLDREYFLTKLERTMWSGEMSYDIALADDTTVNPWTGAEEDQVYEPKHERPFDWGVLIIVNIIAVPALAIASLVFRFALNRFVKKKKLGVLRALAYGLAALVLLNIVLFSGQLGEIMLQILLLPFMLLSGIGSWLDDLLPLLFVGLVLAIALAGVGAVFYAMHWASSKLLKD
jgi:hypothetical protein